jgi:hypothetical protein
MKKGVEPRLQSTSKNQKKIISADYGMRAHGSGIDPAGFSRNETQF